MRDTEQEEETTIVLGLGQMQAAHGPHIVLVCLGLGSCVALCAYDPVRKVGGMAHMVLPHSSEARSSTPSPKFVDCAVPMLIKEMEGLGVVKSRLVVKIVGGSQMIHGPGQNGLFNIGQRNVESAKTVLGQLGLRLQGADTGGERGRTARLYLDSGKLTVSTVGEASSEL